MPTVTFGNRTGDTYSGVVDARTNGLAATTNYETSTVLAAYTFGDPDIGTFWLRFPVNSVTGPVTVSDARLYLYSEDTSTQTVTIFECLRAVVASQITYNIFSTGNNWTTGGGRGSGSDRGSSSLGTITAGGAAGYVSFSSAALIALVEARINANQTLDLISDQTLATDNGVLFTSSDGTNAQRPYLEVTYTAGGGGGGDTLVVVGNPQRNRRTSGRRM